MQEITAFTVGGNDVRDYVVPGTISGEFKLAGRSVLRFQLDDPAGTFRPDIRGVVYFELDGAPVFGGVVWTSEEDSIGGDPKAEGTSTIVEALDFTALTDVVLFNGIIDAGNVDDVIAPLIQNLAPHGITVSPSQTAGPALEAFGFDFQTIRQCLDAVAARLPGWTWLIDPNGEFLMFPVGANVNAVGLTQETMLSARVRRTLNQYANDGWCVVGPPDAREVGFARNDAEYLQYGPFTFKEDRGDLTTEAEAQAAAADILRERIGIPTELRGATLETVFRPGDSAPIDLPKRNLPATSPATYAFLTEIQLRYLTIATTEGLSPAEYTHRFVFDLLGYVGNVYRRNWDRFWRERAPGYRGGAGLSTPTINYANIQTRAGGSTAAGTSHSITLPSGINAGDLIVVVFGTSGQPTVSVDTGASGAGWTIADQRHTTLGVDACGAVVWKEAAGSDVLTLTTSLSVVGSHRTFRISGQAASSPVSVTGIATNFGSNNPPNHVPPGGDNSYLWIVARCASPAAATQRPTAAPTNYGNFAVSFTTSGAGSSVGVGDRQLLAGSENPGTFTVSSNTSDVCFTIAVQAAS